MNIYLAITTIYCIYNYMQTNPRYAFTLIELLAVLGVLVVLAGIALPTVALISTRARQTACQNNLRTLSVAIEGYRLANNGWYPLAVPDCRVLKSDGSLGDNYLFFQTAPRTFGTPPFARWPDADRDGAYEYGTAKSQTYLWAALIPYGIVPPTPAGDLDANTLWRCPARQRKDTGSGPPLMMEFNKKWNMGYRYNYARAAISMLPRMAPGRAVVINDSCLPGFSATDHAHADGSVGAAFADGRVERISFDRWRSLNAGTTNADELTNRWWLDGWE